MISKNIFKIIIFISATPILLFAPKSGEPCISSGDHYTGRGNCFSGFGSGECAAPCVGNYGESEGSTACPSNYGSNSSQGSSNSSTQSSKALPDWSLSAQQLQNRIYAECYVTPNGQICTKGQVVEAAKKLTDISFDLLLQGQCTYLNDLLAAKLFGIQITPLDCAIATKAPENLCLTAARIKQLETQIKELKSAADKIQKDSDARIQQNHQQAKAMMQRLENSGLWHK